MRSLSQGQEAAQYDIVDLYAFASRPVVAAVVVVVRVQCLLVSVR